MKLLEDRIRRDGHIGAGNVLKVDCFLNHQIDVPFISALGEEFYRLYKDAGITKILTIEASGIGIACLTAMHFGVPVLFAKKTPTNNIYGDIYTAEVYSYTHERTYTIYVSRQFLTPDDRVLIIDDFLANGYALQGLISIVHDAGATVEGIGIAIEKGFQIGGQVIRNLGYHLESLAIVESMDPAAGAVKFREQD